MWTGFYNQSWRSARKAGSPLCHTHRQPYEDPKRSSRPLIASYSCAGSDEVTPQKRTLAV